MPPKKPRKQNRHASHRTSRKPAKAENEGHPASPFVPPSYGGGPLSLLEQTVAEGRLLGQKDLPPLPPLRSASSPQQRDFAVPPYSPEHLAVLRSLPRGKVEQILVEERRRKAAVSEGRAEYHRAVNVRISQLRLVLGIQESEETPAYRATEAASNPGELGGGEPTEREGTVKETRRAAVNSYIQEVLAQTGKRITRTDIWKKAGYRSRTEFERWQRGDKRANKAADKNFNRILTDKPHLNLSPK